MHYYSEPLDPLIIHLKLLHSVCPVIKITAIFNERPVEVVISRKILACFVVEVSNKLVEFCLLIADRIGRLLERFGLSTSCLSQSGSLSLKTLVDVSLTLGIQHATDSEYVLTSFCI